MEFELPVAVPRKRRSFYALSALVRREFGIPLGRQLADILFYGLLRRQFGVMGYFDVLPPEFRDGTGPRSARDYVNGNGAWRRVNRPLLTAANPVSAAILEDKPLFYAFGRALGLPVEPCLALWRPARPSLDARRLRDGADMAAFLREGPYPMFGKPVDAQSGLGAVSLAAYEAADDSLRLLDGARVGVADFVAVVLRDFPRGYLFQRRIPQHPAIAELCGDTVSTVRIVTVAPEGAAPSAAYASWKIARPLAMADNSWRTGSISAAVDLATGCVTRAQSGLGVAGALVRTCPQGTQLIGRRLPFWDETLAAALNAHAAFVDVRIVGWDVAVTPDGPVILEGNTRPNHLAYQISSGRGVLSADFANLAGRLDRGRGARALRRSLDAVARKTLQLRGRIAAAWTAFGPSALRR